MYSAVKCHCQAGQVEVSDFLATTSVADCPPASVASIPHPSMPAVHDESTCAEDTCIANQSTSVVHNGQYNDDDDDDFQVKTKKFRPSVDEVYSIQLFCCDISSLLYQIA